MKKFPILIVILLAMLAIIDPTSAVAGDKKKKKPEHFDPLISSVSAESITITKGDATKTFKISPQTQIQVRGQRATAADLQTGMMANVTVGMQSDVAGNINAVDAPAHPEKKDEKKKK
ncbi:MAG: hypothetical protein QOD99_2366 [Chthoniobacter sp.]|jgi:hypothetical protein|nr:hypothetical protein [Chthoniobacter sp.]